MSERVIWYRNRQTNPLMQQMFANDGGVDGWALSLQALGTCCYRGSIPVSAITRAVQWPDDDKNVGLHFSWDPTITLLNQQFCGNRYRAMTAKLFGDQPQPVSTFDQQAVDRLQLTGATYYWHHPDGTMRKREYGIEPSLETCSQKITRGSGQ